MASYHLRFTPLMHTHPKCANEDETKDRDGKENGEGDED
jgi:hypothetical protein